MHIVDSQIHIFRAPTADRPWPAANARFVHTHASVLAEDVLPQMDAAGIAAAYLVPPSFEGDYNDVVLDAVTRHPARFRILGRLALHAPDARAQLESISRMWQMRGIRLTFLGPTKQWIRDGSVEWLWPLAEELGVAVSIYAFGELPAIERIARLHPRLRVSIDHLSLSHRDVMDAAILPVIDALVGLARYPNVAVKATCLPSYVTEAYPYPTLQQVLHRVIGAFGAERVFFGSDLTRLPGSYRQLVEFFDHALAGRPARERELVMGRAAMDWYGWGDPAVAR